ncbi:MAG TPA: 5-methyltetrahydropteroyltriglutamate--homocysteine methyltransferase [Stellaceae bacterium]|nr:5-methyltetrahydropteroyltriglutamate--homocysteine methyltransferase [Stellaceae bacterium]
MPARLPLIPTTIVGSYPQPSWLVDHDAAKGIPRVGAPQMWRIPEAQREAAQDDATRLAIHDLEAAGIDIITDGEIRRESYSNRFALALEGIDLAHPGAAAGRAGGSRTMPVPRVAGKIRWKGPVEVRDAAFLVAEATHRTKITLPGPFTLAQQVQNDFYKDDEEMAMDYAVAVNQELKAIKATGIDIVQLDEPWLQARPEQANRYGVKAINRALDGVAGPTAIHLCMGYAHVVKEKPDHYSFLTQLADSTVDQISIEAAQPRMDLGVLKGLSNKTIILGVIDLGTHDIETPEEVAKRIERALPHVAAERIMPAPDCGMKYMPRAVAYGKLKALAAGAAIVRKKLGG